jgi:predicted deacylase/mRNA-degrading endonuclease toxin of MazEF toxin-antitoxin module
MGDACDDGEWAHLPAPEGSAPGFRRPVVVVQGDAFNRSALRTALCVPLTSNLRWAEAPGNVLLTARSSGLPRDSVANVSQLVTLDRSVLVERVGKLPRRSWTWCSPGSTSSWAGSPPRTVSSSSRVGVMKYPTPLTVGPLVAGPGTRVSGVVPVDLGEGRVVELPIVVVHGALPGARVAVTAGIHGAEYVSIVALREVAMSLDPARVRGSLVAVLTANPAAFAARTIYLNPMDGTNLNRVFPGKADGSPTQRLARWITDHVIAGSDVFVDMHCGDLNEALVSFTGIEETGDADVDARSRALAEAYGLRYLLIGPASGTTTTAAASLGISAVLGEVGGQGRWPAEDVALHAAGFRRLLRAAGLVDEAPETPRHLTEILRTEAWMRATSTGYWHPSVEVGMRIAKGTVVGEVRDAFGKVLEQPIAPLDGVVIFLVTSLAMNEGDPLLALAG